MGERLVFAGIVSGLLFSAGNFGGKAYGKPGRAFFPGNSDFHVCGAEAFRYTGTHFGASGAFAGGGSGGAL